MREVFPGVFNDKNAIYTLNAIPGRNVYGESLKKEGSKEYRFWDAYRSKLGAAIVNGLKELPIRPGSNVLYLGIAEGTSASHVAEIIGPEGIVFGIDVAPKVMRKLLTVCETRQNIIPLMADANHPEVYAKEVEGIEFDCVFEDVAQANQAEILIRNAKVFLKKGAHAMIAVKSQCIDSTRPPREVFNEVRRELATTFEVLQEVNLEPFEGGHVLYLLRMK